MGGVTQNVDETDAFVESAVDADANNTHLRTRPRVANLIAYCGFCHGADGEGYTADNATRWAILNSGKRV